jgi:predicted cupin superfamily sugar epimerase
VSPPPEAGEPGALRPGQALIAALDLSPHPEGGWYRRTWVAEAEDGTRPGGSAIYYLLLQGEISAPHRIDATELWHFYAGDPLELSCEWPDGRRDVQVLGPDVASGHRPQVVVAAAVWQSARPLGRYALVGATVTPAFSFDGFELRQDAVGPG